MDGEDLMQFHAAELLDAHAHLDRAGVPRRSPEGELLSISQRAKLAADLVLALVTTRDLIARVRG